MIMKPRFVVLFILVAITVPRAFPQLAVKPAGASVRVGVFREEVRRAYTTKENLPSNDVRSIAITASGDVYAATAQGLARFSAGA